jgi:hypothetical protein
MTLKKCYSLDDETYNYSGIGELIDNCIDLQVGDTYWEADCKDVVASDYLNAGDILDQADERLAEDVGEVADSDFSSVSKEAVDELNALLKAWVEKHVTLRYWTIVGKTRECKLTQEDLS